MYYHNHQLQSIFIAAKRNFIPRASHHFPLSIVTYPDDQTSAPLSMDWLYFVCLQLLPFIFSFFHFFLSF